MALRDWCVYDTVRFTRIRSWKIALLYYLIFLGILVYIFVVSIGLDRGYQAQEEVSGSVTLKLKGWAVSNETGAVFDAADLVTYYSSSAFLPLLLDGTNQTRGTCTGNEADERCATNGDCRAGRQLESGVDTGTCNTTAGFCIVNGWCPPEGPATRHQYLEGTGNFSVFVRVDAAFPRWGIRTSNVQTEGSGPGGLTWGVNLFEFSDLLRRAGVPDDDRTRAKGAVLRLRYTYNCDCDRSISRCSPSIDFFRVDNPANAVSSGYNFREVVYSGDPGHVTTQRLLRKKAGVVIQVTLVGQGGKFDIVSLLTRIGSGLALLGIASILADMCILYIHRAREYYTNKKFFVVEDHDEADDPDDEYQPFVQPDRGAAAGLRS
eukprot:TRINITY_DN1995_c0_g1_i1.p1 TRINITY_DN1995_c0_g1~~TRINITY_DN1995_c0_g1_i1.p1  ORF type:complete len:377 (+),score=119.04 TRINITY_DN1995_c0_g1_i1:113-1243(+)